MSGNIFVYVILLDLFDVLVYLDELFYLREVLLLLLYERQFLIEHRLQTPVTSFAAVVQILLVRIQLLNDVSVA
jgi:hypothetical protein